MKKLLLAYILTGLFFPILAQSVNYNLFVQQKNTGANYFIPIDSVQNIVFQNYVGKLLINKKNNFTPISVQTDSIKDITFLNGTNVTLLISMSNSSYSVSIPLDSIETILTQKTGGNTISGLLLYANTASTVLGNTKIFLYNGTTLLDSTITDAGGAYAFTNKTNGTYSVSASCNKPWGGVNSTDALLIRRYIVGTSAFDTLQIKSADVNGSSSINSTDALLIRRRVTGIDSTFKIGDWVFDNPAVEVNNSNATKNIRALCIGDVNGSYVPSSLQKSGKISLLRKGVTGHANTKNIKVPLTVNQDINISALTLDFHYSKNLINIIDIESELEGLLFSVKNGALKIAWDNIIPINVGIGKPLITLIVKPLTSEITPVEIDITSESELADKDGKVLENVVLTMPSIATETVKEFHLEQNYPNPFNPVTNITFSLPKTSSVKLAVYNSLGQMVRELINKDLQAGVHETKFDALQLTSGVYFYTIKAIALDGSGEYNATRKLILLK